MPYYPEWSIAPSYRGNLWSSEQQGAVTIRRAWHYVRPHPTTITRLLHELTLSLLSIPNFFRVFAGAEQAYIVSPALSYAFTATLVAKLFRVRTVLVIKDVMPDAAVELGMLKNSFLIGLSRRLARWIYKRADEIHTLGEGMRRRVERDADGRKVRIIPDTIDAAELEPVPYDVNEFRRRFVPKGTFAVLHTGNMGQKQDLDLLLRTAQRLRHDPGVHFYVFGDGATKDRFLRLRAEHGLSNISHYPLQERAFLRHMLSGADLVLISQLPEVVDIVVPSKLVTALGAGAMIVGACAPESETARLIGESGGGLLVPASDDEALAATIQRLRSRQVDTARLRRQAREFAVRRFDRNAIYGALLA